MNDYPGDKIRLNVSGSCLEQQNKLMYTHCKIVNIYIVYELGLWTGYVISFGVDMSSSVHVDNKKNDILIILKGPAQRLEHTLTA